MKKEIKIIAEAGVNHNGQISTALKMVEIAANAGADYIKFQTFKSEKLVSRFAMKADYQKRNFASGEHDQLSMLKKLELSKEDHHILKKHCQKCKIEFLSTPFDLESIEFLGQMDIPFWKIPSGEITNLPYLIKVASYGKPVVLSTGMSTLSEISDCIDTLKRYGNGIISLLHCNTEYPTPFMDVNLNAIALLRSKFGVDVGYSDHTIGIEVPIAAAALGATIIEKHFTLDTSWPGPDHKSSLNPTELKQMILCIRNIEMAMGTSDKFPTNSEQKNISIARKSIVAACPIKKGEYFSEKNLTVKRPGDGISPMRWFQILGCKAGKDFAEDELIEI